MSETAKIILEGKTYEFPVYTGSEAKSRSTSATCGTRPATSRWTWATRTPGHQERDHLPRWEKGVLHLPRYPIEQLARKPPSWKCLPAAVGRAAEQAQMEQFEGNIRYHFAGPREPEALFEFYPSNAHPMGILSAMVNS
jgi:citrate synthase